jgi:formate-dependent phosphoribosylglycinamide formyltransferase (GAR transformylase)
MDVANASSIARGMQGKTVLFVGAGPRDLRAIERSRTLGVRVVALDDDVDAPGLSGADIAEVGDTHDAEPIVSLGRRHAIDGVVAASSDRAVAVVAAAARELGLPGLAPDVEHVFTNRIAMRRLFAEEGVRQPRFAAARTLHEARAAAATVGFPSLLKPAEAHGSRGVFRLASIDDLDAHLHAALAESDEEEVILELDGGGTITTAIVVERAGAATLVALAGTAGAADSASTADTSQVYPASIFGDVLAEVERVALHAAHVLGLRDGVITVRVALDAGSDPLVVDAIARIPDAWLLDLCLAAVEVDLVEICVRQALGLPVADELVQPRRQQPAAIRFVSGDAGVPSGGLVSHVGSTEKVLAFPGVVGVELYVREGETIGERPAAGPQGYVVAIAETNVEALERATAAARLVDVVVEPV